MKSDLKTIAKAAAQNIYGNALYQNEAELVIALACLDYVKAIMPPKREPCHYQHAHRKLKEGFNFCVHYLEKKIRNDRLSL
jgi:hypothetical protein